MSVASHINHSSAPSPQGEAPVVAGPVTLDDLAGLGPSDLEALYLDARPGWPTSTAISWAACWRRRLCRGGCVPCCGALRPGAGFRGAARAFSAKGDDPRGEGINRVFGGRFARRWFRFETFMAPSRAGDFTAFQLDYDNPGNPGFIRAIKDEVREVAPGLFLGQAYLMWRGRPRLMLYFGLARR